MPFSINNTSIRECWKELSWVTGIMREIAIHVIKAFWSYDTDYGKIISGVVTIASTVVSPTDKTSKRLYVGASKMQKFIMVTNLNHNAHMGDIVLWPCSASITSISLYNCWLGIKCLSRLKEAFSLRGDQWDMKNKKTKTAAVFWKVQNLSIYSINWNESGSTNNNGQAFQIQVINIQSMVSFKSSVKVKENMQVKNIVTLRPSPNFLCYIYHLSWNMECDNNKLTRWKYLSLFCFRPMLGKMILYD